MSWPRVSETSITPESMIHISHDVAHPYCYSVIAIDNMTIVIIEKIMKVHSNDTLNTGNYIEV